MTDPITVGRRMLRSIGVLFAFFVGVSSAIAESRVRLLDECPDDRACLLATLDDASDPEEGYEVRVERESPGELGDFVVTVRGRLNQSRERSLDLIFPVSGGELFCTDFIQSTVPWAGFSATGNPILLTEKGDFELTGNSPVVGCTDCLRLKREPYGNIIASFTTPSWALSLTRLDTNDFSWTDDGQAYVQFGEACVQLSQHDLFRFAPPNRCALRAEFKGFNPAIDQSKEGPDLMLRIEGSNVTSYLITAACT